MADQKLFDSLISAQSAIDSTNLRKRIRVRGRVRGRVRLWERLRGRRAFASYADFAGIEAIDQSGQHRHDALEHLFTEANPDRSRQSASRLKRRDRRRTRWPSHARHRKTWPFDVRDA